jgi:hypothetical protein
MMNHPAATSNAINRVGISLLQQTFGIGVETHFHVFCIAAEIHRLSFFVKRHSAFSNDSIDGHEWHGI